MKTELKNIRIDITQELIDASEPESSTKCMVAQALRLKGLKSIDVSSEQVRFNDGIYRYFYQLSAIAAANISLFDKDRSLVKPFSFNLDARQGAARLIELRKKTGPYKKKEKTEKKKCSVVRCKRRFQGIKIIQVSQ